MGSINLGSAGGFQRSANTRAEFYQEANYESSEKFVLRLSNSLIGKEKACYVYGMGGLPRKVYVELSQEPGVEVLYFRSTLPIGVRFLQYVVGSFEGLVKIKDLAKLPMVFSSLTNQSMAGIYCLSPVYEKEFIKHVKEFRQPRNYDFGIKNDSSYLMYIVDADNYEVSSGVIEFVSYGNSISNDIEDELSRSFRAV